jgi:hypothetical protein
MPRPEHAVGDSTIETRSHAAIEIADQMHDRSRDLLQDPPDEDEVWFDAEALAAASTVDLGSGDHLERSPALDQITAAIASAGISLARLPGWPQAGVAGQGLGAIAEDLIGELRPGDLVLFGGSQRGVGRTSLLAQLGDGLALASDPERPATPVLFVGEGTPALWRARSLARFFDVDARLFVEAERARREPRLVELLEEFRRGPWAGLDERQRFVGREALTDPDRRSATILALRRWQSELSTSAWPIMIVDPLEQLSGRADMVETLRQLAALAQVEHLIVLASCDLGDADAAQARAIDSVASVRLRATAVDDRILALELCHRRLGPRGSGQLRWHRASGRFEPYD